MIAQVLRKRGAVYNLDITSATRRRDHWKYDRYPRGPDRSGSGAEIVERTSRMRHLDFLINAGITYKCRAEEYPMESTKQIQDVNLNPYLSSAACVIRT